MNPTANPTARASSALSVIRWPDRQVCRIQRLRRPLVGVAGWVGVALLAGLCSCGGAALSEPEVDSAQYGKHVEPLETTTWTAVGTGVNYRATGAGNNVFIGYAGYQATDAETESWTNALYTAQLQRLGVGYLYAVRGPNEVTYAHREIGNTKLILHMLSVTSASTKLVVVASHSSGSYVANEMFGFLFDGHWDNVGRTPGRTVYYNLDGGDGLTTYTLSQLADAYFVHAYDGVTKTSSANASGMITLSHRSPPKTAGLTVAADAAGCNSGAVWCLHDVMITQRPHSATGYDLLDYSDFSGRPVQDSYLLQSWSTLTGVIAH